MAILTAKRVAGAGTPTNPAFSNGLFGLTAASPSHTASNAKGAWASGGTLTQAIDQLALRLYNSASRLFLLDIRHGGSDIVVENLPLQMGINYKEMTIPIRLPAGTIEYRVAPNVANSTLDISPVGMSADVPNPATHFLPVGAVPANPAITGVALTAANAPAWTAISSAGLPAAGNIIYPYIGGNNIGSGRLPGTCFLELGTSPDGINVTPLPAQLPLIQTAASALNERMPLIRGQFPAGTYFHARMYLAGSPTAQDQFNCQIHVGRAA